MTIYQATPPPWATGTKSIQSFASGLLRVDQEYMVPTATAFTDGAAFVRGAVLTDTTSPAVDGLYVYPDPQWSDGGDGFSTIAVSAYGRTQTTVQDLTQEQGATSTGIFQYNVWKLSGSICLLSGESLSLVDLGLDEALFAPCDFFSEVYPDEYALSTTETDASFQIGYDGTGGTTRTYSIEMTADGETVTRTITLRIRDPSVVITSIRPFGQFVEYDFETARKHTSSTVT
mgnify:FL=1